MNQLKIVSLVPSLTLLLADLGLQDALVGRTRFCIHPEHIVKQIAVVGGTKQADLQKIRILKPDMILANKEENDKEQILQLQKEFSVLVTDVKNPEDNYRMIAKIGKLTNKEKEANDLIKTTRKNFSELQTYVSALPALNCLYLIWRKPYMSIGRDTFIHSMLHEAGLKNMFGHQTRYPIVQNLETSYFSKCELVLLSSEPYPFAEKHSAEIRQLLPKAMVMLVNGEYFSWYGSRIKDTPAYLKTLLQTIHEQNSL
jgi:ABC-type Fe3+-hydroxamate transport system substrate-binding protein